MRKLVCSFVLSFALIVSGCGGSGGDSGQTTTSKDTSTQETQKTQKQNQQEQSKLELETVKEAGDNWGTVKGMVKLSGAIPEIDPVPVNSSHQRSCRIDAPKATPNILSVDKDTKAVQDAFVFLKNVETALKPELPSKTLTIDQKGCRFNPNAGLLRKGGTVVVKNSDPTTHNFRYKGVSNPLFKGDRNQSEGADDIRVKMETLDFVKFKCNVHQWMDGMIRTANHHAYKLTSEDGKFSFQVPPGKYTLVVKHFLHSDDSAYEKEITVKEDGTVEQDVELKLSP